MDANIQICTLILEERKRKYRERGSNKGDWMEGQVKHYLRKTKVLVDRRSRGHVAVSQAGPGQPKVTGSCGGQPSWARSAKGHGVMWRSSKVSHVWPRGVKQQIIGFDGKRQLGWEFSLRFLERIAHFL